MPDALSHYALLELIGTGGMGTVYRAKDQRSGDIVALKTLHSQFASDAVYVRRFEAEARIAQGIDSPNVVKVLDAGHENGTYFVVMEYVPGSTLADVIRIRGELPVAEAIAVATAIARGLIAANARGVVHRDISPQNVIITGFGQAKVTDFGISRDLNSEVMTANSMLLGKPLYIAPEVVTGVAKADIRSDIYALGVIVFQTLIGRVPFNADTPYAVMQKHVHEPTPPLRSLRGDIPDWLVNVVERCLAKDPGDRFQGPGAVLAALEAGDSEATVHMPKEAPTTSIPRPPEATPVNRISVARVEPALAKTPSAAEPSNVLAEGTTHSESTHAPAQAEVLPPVEPQGPPNGDVEALDSETAMVVGPERESRIIRRIAFAAVIGSVLIAAAAVAVFAVGFGSDSSGGTTSKVSDKDRLAGILLDASPTVTMSAAQVVAPTTPEVEVSEPPAPAAEPPLSVAPPVPTATLTPRPAPTTTPTPKPAFLPQSPAVAPTLVATAAARQVQPKECANESRNVRTVVTVLVENCNVGCPGSVPPGATSIMVIVSTDGQTAQDGTPVELAATAGLVAPATLTTTKGIASTNYFPSPQKEYAITASSLGVSVILRFQRDC